LDPRLILFSQFDTWLTNLATTKPKTATNKAVALYLSQEPRKRMGLFYASPIGLRLGKKMLTWIKKWRPDFALYEISYGPESISGLTWVRMNKWCDDIWFIGRRQLIFWDQEAAAEFTVSHADLNSFARLLPET